MLRGVEASESSRGRSSETDSRVRMHTMRLSLIGLLIRSEKMRWSGPTGRSLPIYLGVVGDKSTL